jgi:hypothetical protein
MATDGGTIHRLVGGRQSSASEVPRCGEEPARSLMRIAAINLRRLVNRAMSRHQLDETRLKSCTGSLSTRKLTQCQRCTLRRTDITGRFVHAPGLMASSPNPNGPTNDLG